MPVDVGIAHILKGILYDFLSQRVGRDVTPVAIGLGNRVVVLDNHKLGRNIAGAPIAENLVPAVGLAGDGEPVSVIDGTENAVVGTRP